MTDSHPQAAAARPRRRPVHYGWIIVLAGTLSVFSCLGLGRFALGMLLPSMGQSLGLSYDQMGFISTGNFIGYLAAVLAVGPLVARLGARRLIVLGLTLVAGSMLLVAQAQSFPQVLVLYVLTGVGSGAANVPVMGLVAHWFGPRRRGRAAGFIVVGSGFAIIFSGNLVPLINQGVGGEGWRVSWAVLGGIALAVAVLAGLLIRNHPQDKGLEPVAAEAHQPHRPHHARPRPPSPAQARRLLGHLGLIYALFGYTYAIYVTFVVTTLVQERGFSEETAGAAWAWIGFLSLFSGPVFGSLSDRLGRKAALMMVFALQGAAYLLMALPLGPWTVYASIICYGLAAFAIPGIMAAATGDYLGPEKAAAAFGTITFIFGLGQIAGPAVAGMLAEAQDSFAGSYLMSAVLAGAGIALSGLLRRPGGR